jgi:hypothetical protein
MRKMCGCSTSRMQMRSRSLSWHKSTTQETASSVGSVHVIGRGERIRTSDLSVPNHRFGKKLSFCHFRKLQPPRVYRVLRSFPIRCQQLPAFCCEFCPQIGHTFLGEPSAAIVFAITQLV